MAEIKVGTDQITRVPAVRAGGRGIVRADVQRAAVTFGPLLEPGKPAVPSAGANPDAIIAHVQDETAVFDTDHDGRGSRAGMPDDVGHCFPHRADEIVADPVGEGVESVSNPHRRGETQRRCHVGGRQHRSLRGRSVRPERSGSLIR